MRIEIWTDIICPWCGIGNHRLESALAKFEHIKDVEVVHRSFQLDERADPNVTQTAREMLKKKKGMSDAQISSITKRIESMAEAEGLKPYVVAENMVGNTSLAHELAAWATDIGRGKDMWDALYRAYFGEKKSIFDVTSLVEIARDVGLDADKALDVLTSRHYAKQVQADGAAAHALGASGVPFVVIDRKYAIPGAQPVEVFSEAIETAWRERSTVVQVAANNNAESCGPDGCETPSGHALN